MDDESFWRSAYVIKRITSDEREFRLFPGLNNADIFRIDGFRGFDHIFIGLAKRRDPDAVPSSNAFEIAKKCVAVRRNCDIARRTRQRSFRQMTGARGQ